MSLTMSCQRRDDVAFRRLYNGDDPTLLRRRVWLLTSCQRRDDVNFRRPYDVDNPNYKYIVCTLFDVVVCIQPIIDVVPTSCARLDYIFV